jgi:hypothetical protein
VHQVGHYPELHQDARSTKHKISQIFIYSVFLMAKPDVDVFREDKTFMVNGMFRY